MGVEQVGHADGGLETDSPLGTRQITTLAKEPNANPNAKSAMMNSVCSVLSPPMAAFAVKHSPTRTPGTQKAGGLGRRPFVLS